MDLINLAILFRAINLFSHHAHNMASGDTFMQDHAFYAEIYALMDDFYDECIERHIGTVDDKVDLKSILISTSTILAKTNDNFYETILKMLEQILDKIEVLSKEKLSQGTINLVVGQADQIEILIYKIKRRIK